MLIAPVQYSYRPDAFGELLLLIYYTELCGIFSFSHF